MSNTVKVKCVDVCVEHCLKVKCVDVKSEIVSQTLLESKVRGCEGVCRTL